MEQYISKAALLAELNRRKIPFKKDIEDGYYPTYLCAIMDFEDYLDILEVKEVDLGKEIEKCLKRHNMLAVGKKDFTDIAKYFFELGLRAQKGE